MSLYWLFLINNMLGMGWDQISSLLKSQQGIVVDIKSVLDVDACPQNVTLWRL